MAAVVIDKSNMSSFCFYYLQGQPGESWSSPNAFKLLSNSPGPQTLSDCKMSFPLANEGQYHWRFRTSTAGGFYWKDVFEDEETLPLYQGVCFAKILRLDMLPALAPSKIRYHQRQSQSKAKPAPQHSAALHSAPQHSAAAPARPAPYSDAPPAQARSDHRAPPAPSPAPAPASPPAAPKPPPKPETRAEKTQREYREAAALQKKVWDPVDERWVVVANKHAPTTSPKPTQPAPPDANALFGMSAPPSADPLGSAPPEQEASNVPSARIRGVTLSAENTVGKSESVAAAMMERVDEMQTSQAKAVKEFRDRQQANQDADDEEDEIRRRLDPTIKAWSEEYGKKRPLRALVSSLDKVLWENSGVPVVNLGDILDPSKARKAYLKASRFVHPDKTKKLDPEKRFIAKRVFDALSQANAEFLENGSR